MQKPHDEASRVELSTARIALQMQHEAAAVHTTRTVIPSAHGVVIVKDGLDAATLFFSWLRAAHRSAAKPSSCTCVALLV